MAWLIYLMEVVDGIKVVSGIVAGISICGLIIMLIAYGSECVSYGDKEDRKTYARLARSLAIPAALFATVSVFTPSSKTMAAMYLMPRVVENEQVQQLPDKVLKVMNGRLDKWIDEMKPSED